MARGTGPGGKVSRAWLLYGVLGAAVAVGHLFLPEPAQSVVYNAVGIAAVAAVLLGVRRWRPRLPAGWYLFCSGLLLTVVGEIAWDYYELVLGQDPFPSLADAFYLSGYPFMAVGLVFMIRARAPGHDRAGLIDATIVAIGAGVLSWVFLIDPYVNDASVPLLERAISMAYPLGDLLLVAVAARLLVGEGTRPLAYGFLLLGLLFLLVTDSVYAYLSLAGTYEDGGVVEIGWLFSYLLSGVAALHPSMRAMTEVGTARGRWLSRWRLALLAVASLSAPCVLLLQYLRGENVNAPVIFAGSVALFSMVLLRMEELVTGLVASLRENDRSIARERVLREAGVALVAARDAGDIRAAAVGAALSLARQCSWGNREESTPPRALLLSLEQEPGSSDGSESLDASFLPRSVSNLLAEGRSVEIEGAETAALRGALGVDHGSFFLVPLLVRGGLRGMLVLASSAPVSPETGTALEALGSEVALALESAALSEDLYLRRSEERFGSLIQNSSDVITVLDGGGTVLYASPSVLRATGLAPDEVTGGAASSLVHPDDAVRLRRFLDECLAAPFRGASAELRYRHTDGSWRSFEAVGKNLTQDENVGGVLVNARDITERKALEESLEHQAFHDGLTGLPNRALFVDRLEHALARAGRGRGGGADAAGSLVALLFVDLDGFKNVNDSLGHAAGDDLLVQAARRLGECVRPGDTVARLGGDEFTLLLEDVSGPEEALPVAERLAWLFEAPFSAGGREVYVTASVGVVVGGSESLPEELLRAADIAMYEAKKGGKARHAIFEEAMNQRVARRFELEADLRRALEGGELEVYYQPIVWLDSGLTHELEALVRWRRPGQGLVSPADFVPLAEETDLILPIGRHVLREACRQASGINAERLGRHAEPIALSVNLSAKQFGDPGLVGDVACILRETGFAPRDLKLEITESLMMENAASTMEALKELKALGVRIAVDDFGMGYSSLSYLKRFPVDYLKIDRSFVERLGRDPEDESIVVAIIAVARSLGLGVVAEGIETQEQRDKLLALGCERGQGYHFSRPLPADELGPVLASGMP